MKFKVAIIEMNPRIPWVLFMDPLGSAEHTLGNTALKHSCNCKYYTP
jgi:hypothetical protein